MKTVVISVVRDFAMYDRLVRGNPNLAGAELVAVDNRVENLPMPKRYNAFLDARPADEDAWYVFCHEDFEFLEPLDGKLDGLDPAHVYGTVGIDRKWRIWGNMTFCNKDGSGVSGNEHPVSAPVEVATLDCCCLAVHASLVRKCGLRFDEGLSWDLYTEAFSVEAAERFGVRTYVAPIAARHWSFGKIQPRFQEQLDYLNGKWRDAVEAYPTTNMKIVGNRRKGRRMMLRRRLLRGLWHKRHKQDGTLCVSVLHVPVYQGGDGAGPYRCVWTLALAYWVLASALAAFYKLTITDVVFRYVPMAESFAQGDWSLAFHPRFGVLFQILSGSLVWLGFTAEHAVQIVPFLFVAAGAAVMWRVSRTLFGPTVAWWTFAILLFEPLTTGYAMAGWRDPCKCLVFALLALGAVERKPAAYGLGLMIYIMLFSYGFATSSLFLLLWCAWFAWKREWRMLPGPMAGWGAGTLSVTLMTHAFTGYWLPAPHFIEICDKLRGCL